MISKLKRNNKMTDFLLLLILITIIQACSTPYLAKLKPLYEQAGRNQSELKKVIKHYSSHKVDSLKLKAALFLIENMDAHFSYQSKNWETFQIELDTLFSHETDGNRMKAEFKKIYTKYDLSDVKYVSDLLTVNFKFLISNIDSAFIKWERPYARHINFNQFCEYLLPYRIGNEPTDKWRDIFASNYLPAVYSKLKSPRADNSAIGICDIYKSYPFGYLEYLPADVPDFNSRLLSKLRLGTCREFALQTIMASRCMGMPVVLDFTPQWATRSLGHEWNALISESGKPLCFGIGDRCKLGEHIEYNPDRVPPKVFRETFAKQKESLALQKGNEEVPPVFESPCMIDVTADYYQTANLTVKLTAKNPEQKRFAYLAVFDNRDWIPVDWSKIINGEVTFRNIHKGIVCLPTFYSHEQVFPAANAVLITESGKIQPLIPNYQQCQTLILTRKYQTKMVDGYCDKMVHVRFQGDDSLNFKNAETLAEVMEKPDNCYNIIKIKPTKPYKYFRFLAPEKSNGDIAEIELYEQGATKPITGKIIGKTHSPKGFESTNVFDGNGLTSFRTFENWDVWVGLEFDSPKMIDKIVYLPRGDDNGIHDGEIYELFYWDNRWVSLGKQTGSKASYRLIYANAPTNALFLLRDLTKGQEERIFMYENGKQVWW
jgi:hypothetical protein